MPTHPLPTHQRPITRACLALAISGALWLSAGCAPLLVGGAIAGGAMVAQDRRSVGTQLEDEAIERRIRAALDARFSKGPVHVNPTSYDRKVLLVGEAPTEAAAREIETIAASTLNVRAVVNEIYVGLPSTMGNRLNDTALAGKVRAALIDSPEVSALAIKATVERGVAYLMGRVTPAEADAAAQAARRADGLVRVVKVFDLVNEVTPTHNNATAPRTTAPGAHP
ncbi:MAG TPA: BON domain-containing protein [Burkholderiaceae bacterium]|nr:BON domain-containing protein [Burkholderiaceae bacterium]